MGRKQFNRQGSSAGDAEIVYDDGPGRKLKLEIVSSITKSHLQPRGCDPAVGYGIKISQKVLS